MARFLTIFTPKSEETKPLISALYFSSSTVTVWWLFQMQMAKLDVNIDRKLHVISSSLPLALFRILTSWRASTTRSFPSLPYCVCIQALLLPTYHINSFLPPALTLPELYKGPSHSFTQELPLELIGKGVSNFHFVCLIVPFELLPPRPL